MSPTFLSRTSIHLASYNDSLCSFACLSLADIQVRMHLEKVCEALDVLDEAAALRQPALGQSAEPGPAHDTTHESLGKAVQDGSELGPGESAFPDAPKVPACGGASMRAEQGPLPHVLLG